MGLREAQVRVVLIEPVRAVGQKACARIGAKPDRSLKQLDRPLGVFLVQRGETALVGVEPFLGEGTGGQEGQEEREADRAPAWPTSQKPAPRLAWQGVQGWSFSFGPTKSVWNSRLMGSSGPPAR